MSVSPSPPRCITDEPWLMHLLDWFLTRLETGRQRDVIRRVTAKTIPALFYFNEDVAYRWELISEELANNYGVFQIRYARQSSATERYQDAQLRLNSLAEPLLRLWLNRPEISEEQLAWQKAIDLYAAESAEQLKVFNQRRIDIPGLTPKQVVQGLVAVGKHLNQGFSLRELSARCFLGNSKVLDRRYDLLAQLYGADAEAIKARPLLLNVWAPVAFDRVLIVENQDSFLRLYERPPTNCALLYSGGFRAGAQRLLSEHTCFSFLPGSDNGYFQQNWPPTQAHFWGDLDYAGMSILRSLRNSIPTLTAWRPGYVPMLSSLLEGAGHAPEQAKKEEQTDPLNTGCDYTDTELLPALRMTGRFIDQEGFLIDGGQE